MCIVVQQLVAKVVRTVEMQIETSVDLHLYMLSVNRCTVQLVKQDIGHIECNTRSTVKHYILATS